MQLRVPVAVMLGLAWMLGACAPVPPRAVDSTPLVWPEDGDAPARVAFVKAFSRPDEFGIAKGFLERLGEFLFGQQEARLVRPMAVVSVDGIVFVADPGAKGVHRFDPVAERYDLIVAEGGVPLPSPIGLAVGREGEVYVTDSARPAVLVIRPGAKAAVPLPLPKLGQPTGVAVDRGTGRLYVVDTTAHRVAVFDPDGTPHASIGGRGDGDGEFNYPTYVWRDGRGRLYVTDSLNFRVQVFDEQGRFLGKFGKAGDGTGDFMRQKGIATDSFGHVYIVDALMNALQIYDEAGSLLLSIGNLGQSRGEFWLPAGIFVGGDDQIYVADAYNGRIQIFRYIGGPT
jgi:DNA-binding beta-propeller fold protein YncE